MHQGHKIRLARLEEAHRPRQRKIFVVYEDSVCAPAGAGTRADYEAYIAAHGPGSAVVLRVVYAGPLVQAPPT